MTVTKTLTGRTRHRALKRLFTPIVLVLQVEVHQVGSHILPYVGGNMLDHVDVDQKVWRDAQVEDLHMPQLISLPLATS